MSECKSADKEKSAFIPTNGPHKLRGTPFVLCNAPATFDPIMESQLKVIKSTTCLCYLDDVICSSAFFGEHFGHLHNVLCVFCQAQLQLHSCKCRFGSRHLKMLSHLVRRNSIQPYTAKLVAVSDALNVPGVGSFLVLCPCLHLFIPIFPTLARPPRMLLKKNTGFRFDNEQQACFDHHEPVLTSSQFSATLTALHY